MTRRVLWHICNALAFLCIGMIASQLANGVFRWIAANGY
jgi:hypothetical protein